MNTDLQWGRRYLMCPPDHYSIEYAINPWMMPHDRVDPALALKQWTELVSAIEDAGGTVETIEGHPMLPDMVFTANLGIASNHVFVPASMRHPQRARESELAGYWAAGRGYKIKRFPTDVGSFEGMGDALPFAGRLIAGHGSRSSTSAWTAISARLGWPITPIELPDERLYHIDLVFSPLSDRQALVAPKGLTDQGLRTILSIVPEPIFLEDEETLCFSANSIVVNRTVIMPACSDRLRRILQGAGFEVTVVNVGEFLKAGGAVRCLTLPLDLSIEGLIERTA